MWLIKLINHKKNYFLKLFDTLDINDDDIISSLDLDILNEDNAKIAVDQIVTTFESFKTIMTDKVQKQTKVSFPRAKEKNYLLYCFPFRQWLIC